MKKEVLLLFLILFFIQISTAEQCTKIDISGQGYPNVNELQQEKIYGYVYSHPENISIAKQEYCFKNLTFEDGRYKVVFCTNTSVKINISQYPSFITVLETSDKFWVNDKMRFFNVTMFECDMEQIQEVDKHNKANLIYRNTIRNTLSFPYNFNMTLEGDENYTLTITSNMFGHPTKLITNWVPNITIGAKEEMVLQIDFDDKTSVPKINKVSIPNIDSAPSPKTYKGYLLSPVISTQNPSLTKICPYPKKVTYTIILPTEKFLILKLDVRSNEGLEPNNIREENGKMIYQWTTTEPNNSAAWLTYSYKINWSEIGKAILWIIVGMIITWLWNKIRNKKHKKRT
ncbi:MAG: hypothetical protein ACP5NZ_05445 [Nanobdellota archaeon]